MHFRITRREWTAAALGAAAANAMPRPAGLLIDAHIHLFARDQKAFPFHANAPYRPEPQTLEDYAAFVRSAKIDHAVIVHPEPYQDDHRYLEHCFQHEPSPGFFKGTCLFDTNAPDTAQRMRALVTRYPRRIIALRVHQMREAGQPPQRTGAIKERDLASPEMAKAWKEAESLGMAVQMHFVPAHARGIGALASRFADMRVILDHLGRPGQGTPAEYQDVLALAKLPNTWMKFSGWRYASKQDSPYADLKSLIRRLYDAFGPQRIIWGGLGMNMADFKQNAAILDTLFHFAGESERAMIRGTNAARLFAFAT